MEKLESGNEEAAIATEAVGEPPSQEGDSNLIEDPVTVTTEVVDANKLIGGNTYLS